MKPCCELRLTGKSVSCFNLRLGSLVSRSLHEREEVQSY